MTTEDQPISTRLLIRRKPPARAGGLVLALAVLIASASIVAWLVGSLFTSNIWVISAAYIATMLALPNAVERLIYPAPGRPSQAE